uniref:autotransporter outer membrane beta-barrel domain-containing protein n=1 Tax=uncultured Nitratireductor sp. TaxID=520953 RepID=UPI0025EEBE80
AAIVALPASEAGTARIEREVDAYRLQFAAAGAFAGTASLTYTLSNAEGTSEPATVRIEVIARSDPTQDPEVIGLIRAQTEAAKRFARMQTGNFNRRLEQLHDEGSRRQNSMNLNVGVQTGSSNRNAYVEEKLLTERPAARALDRSTRKADHKKRPAKPRSENPFGELAIWTSGYVNFGTSEDGGLDLDHTLVGVSGGLDYRFTPQFIAGIGFGYGRDTTDVGDNGTENRAHAISLAAYGSYRPDPAIFIDGLVGYSFMDFDSRRSVTATGDIASGERDGDQLFGSLSVGYEHRRDGLLLSPYGRLEASHSTLDAFTETGGGLYSLTYGEQTIDTLSGALGLRAKYAIAMSWGVFTPRGRLEYTHDFEGSNGASLGYADIGGLPYALDIGPFSRDFLTVGLGFDADIGETWTLGFDYRTAFGTDDDSHDHTFGLKLGATF